MLLNILLLSKKGSRKKDCRAEKCFEGSLATQRQNRMLPSNLISMLKVNDMNQQHT